MANATYMQGRKGAYYQRPQAMLWADNEGYLTGQSRFPLGAEVGSKDWPSADGEFLILSDDNRGPIEFANTRIETRERMINGRMRSYHVADKLKISTSWTMLPSRAFVSAPDFETAADQEVAVGKTAFARSDQYTSDGGAGGVEMLDWYENYTGSFWVYLAYDKYTNFKDIDATPYDNINKYSQVVEMYFADFSYTLAKRGIHDFWDVSVTLEEV